MASAAKDNNGYKTMRMRVYTVNHGAAGVAYRAMIDNNTVEGQTGMLFTNYDDMVSFIIMMPITYVAVMIDLQRQIEYGYRLDDLALRDTVKAAQATRKGRKRDISFGVE